MRSGRARARRRAGSRPVARRDGPGVPGVGRHSQSLGPGDRRGERGSGDPRLHARAHARGARIRRRRDPALAGGRRHRAGPGSGGRGLDLHRDRVPERRRRVARRSRGGRPARDRGVASPLAAASSDTPRPSAAPTHGIPRSPRIPLWRGASVRRPAHPASVDRRSAGRRPGRRLCGPAAPPGHVSPRSCTPSWRPGSESAGPRTISTRPKKSSDVVKQTCLPILHSIAGR